ncbi:hypothetical protein CHS0354_034454 [Potamilus streckersoni]|uniref:S1 motif domain-containing protein n=1 Tax=Potamilus streckersoni TaxID=2493646 RepID=A0AAE0RLL0_9BIVA|nr:hypothetical protein CHS0354_034454 [Potamilus streckersoni]
MDSHLLGLAIEYHGPDLLRQLTIEEQPFPESAIDHLHKCRPQSPEIKDEDLMNKVRNFIAKKSDMLFKPVSDDVQVVYNPVEEEDNYGKMPPIETFMGMPTAACRKHFINSLEKRDIVIGVVSSIMDSGLIVTLLCLDSGKSRDIDELKFTAFCPNKELPRMFPNQSAIEAFQVKDKIRGVVLSVNPETEKINISLLDRALPDDAPRPKLGLISEDEFPVQYRRKLHVRGLTFDELLHSIIGFNNCNSVPYLLETLQQKEEVSLMRGLHQHKIPEKEYCENIRKIQSQKWAHQSVASGIKYFKAGKHMEAMQEFNRALQIDTNNVEALVARGALYANNESYHKAIQDFEDALAVNLNHSNARKYLFETLLAVARGIEECGKDLEEAEYYYKKALSIQPESQEARESLRYLHTKREKQGHDKRKRSHDSRTSSTPKLHDQREDSPLRKDKDHRRSTPQRRNSNASHSSSRKCQKHRESTPQNRSSIASHSPEKVQEEDLITSASHADSFLGKTTETLKKLIKEDKKEGKKRKRKSTEDEDSNRRAKKKRHDSNPRKSNDSSFEELYKKEETGKQREWKSGQKSSELSEDHSGRRKMIPDIQQKVTDVPSHDTGLSRRLTFFSTDMQQRGLRIPGLNDSESDNEIDVYESPYHKRSFPDGTQKRIGQSKYENREFEENDRYLELLSPQERCTDARNIDSFDAHSSSAFPMDLKYQNSKISEEKSGSRKKAYSEKNQSEILSHMYNERRDGNFKQCVAVDKDRRSRFKEKLKPSQRATQDLIQNKSPAQIPLDMYIDREDDILKMLQKESAVRKDPDFNTKGMSESSEIISSEYIRSSVMFGNVKEKNASEAITKTSNRGLFVDIPRQLKKVLKKDAQNTTEKTTADNLTKESHPATVDKKFREHEIMINVPEQATKTSSEQSKRDSQGHEKEEHKFDKEDHYDKDVPMQEKVDRESRSSDISQRRLSVNQKRDENRTEQDKERSPTRRRDIRRNQSLRMSGSRSSREPHSRSLKRSCSRSLRRSYSKSSGRSCRRSVRRSHSRSVRWSYSRSSRRSCRRSLQRSHSRSSGKSKKLHKSLRRSCSQASKRSNSRSFERSQSCSTYSQTSSGSSSRHSRNMHLSPSTSDRLTRSPYREKSYRSRFRHREGRRCDKYFGTRVLPFKDEHSRYRGRGRRGGYKGGYYERKDYSEWRRKMLLVERFKAKKDVRKKNKSPRTEKERCSEKIDKSTDFHKLEDKEHQKLRDDSNRFNKSNRRKSVEDDRYIITDITRFPIDSIKDEGCIRHKSQQKGPDKRSPGSPIKETAFGKEDICDKCILSEKSDKLASYDKNPAEDKSWDEMQSLKQLQHDTKYSEQSSPGKESIKSNHSSPFRKNVTSPVMPLMTVDLKSKWDSPKRKSRWGTPDQYSIGIGLEMPLIFTNSWKRGSGSPVVESKLSLNESATVDKAAKEILIELRKEESDTFSIPFKKISPDYGKTNMDKNESGTGGNLDDVFMKRLSDRVVDDFGDEIYRQPQKGPYSINDDVRPGSSQKGEFYQRENIIINVRNTGNEIERITSYVMKDERDGFDESKCQEKGKIEPIFQTQDDDKYDVRRKRDEFYMKERGHNTGCYDDVLDPKESTSTPSELKSFYHKAHSSEHLHPSTTSGQTDLSDLVKALTRTTYSRAQSSGQNNAERQEEMLKSHSKPTERTSSTHSRGGAKGVEKQSGTRSFESHFKRSRSRSLSHGREGKIWKSVNEKSRKEKSRSEKLKLETSPRQKLKTRTRRRSTFSTRSSLSSSSSTCASDSPVGKKHTFTGKKNTSIASTSNLTIGKSKVKDDKAQGKPGGRSITEISEESNKKRRESLDDLENFLNQLKEKKKEQWIAEGKIKDKNSEVVT